MLSLALKRYYDPIRHPPDTGRLHGVSAYTPRLLRAAVLGPGRVVPSCDAHLLTIPPSIPRGVPERCTSRFFTSSMTFTVSQTARLPLVPRGLASRGCKVRFMLRTGQLLPLTRLSTLRFDPERFCSTPAACYPAPWRLPGPDFHRLADITLHLVQSLRHHLLSGLPMLWAAITVH